MIPLMAPRVNLRLKLTRIIRVLADLTRPESTRCPRKPQTCEEARSARLAALGTHEQRVVEEPLHRQRGGSERHRVRAEPAQLDRGLGELVHQCMLSGGLADRGQDPLAEQ